MMPVKLLKNSVTLLLTIVVINYSNAFVAIDKTFNLIDYGAIANDGKDDTEAIRKAIKDAIQSSNSTLFFPAGDYNISDPLALQIQKDAMSGKLGSNPQDKLFVPNKKYAIGLDFSEANNLIISAYGAKLICDGWMELLSFKIL